MTWMLGTLEAEPQSLLARASGGKKFKQRLLVCLALYMHCLSLLICRTGMIIAILALKGLCEVKLN